MKNEHWAFLYKQNANSSDLAKPLYEECYFGYTHTQKHPSTYLKIYFSKAVLTQTNMIFNTWMRNEQWVFLANGLPIPLFGLVTITIA